MKFSHEKYKINKQKRFATCIYTTAHLDAINHYTLLSCLVLCLALCGCEKEQDNALPPPPADVQTTDNPPRKPFGMDDALEQHLQRRRPVENATPNEDPAEAAKYSGGLGLSPEAFNIRLGGRLVDCSEISTDPLLCLGERGQSELTISAKGNIDRISFSVGPGQFEVSPIRQRLQAYLPADARLLDTYSYEFDGEPGLDLNNRSNSIVDIYHSDWLATRFTENQWRKVGTPGRFYIRYRTPPVIEIGNGPSRSGSMRNLY